MLKRLFRFLNRDVTGRTWQREADHPYFGKMIYFGHRDTSKAYWEAELADPESGARFSVTLEGTAAGPEAAEEHFCRTILADLDGLFDRCRDIFRAEFPKWSTAPFPDDWREAFVLDGFSVPRQGNPDGDWHVCYFARPANHYFTAVFEAGRPNRLVVDG